MASRNSFFLLFVVGMMFFLHQVEGNLEEDEFEGLALVRAHGIMFIHSTVSPWFMSRPRQRPRPRPWFRARPRSRSRPRPRPRPRDRHRSY